MKRSLFLAALLSLTFGAPRAFAGEPPVNRVRPGAVATAVVTFATPVAGQAARFSIKPAAGVRILGAATGLLPAGGGATRRIPVTFTVPADAVAGEMVGGSVTLEWAGGRTERQEVRIKVDVVHKLVLSATSAQPIIQPGGVARITYQLANLGNATDTVHVEMQAGAPWTASPPSDSRVLPVGARVEGSFEVRAPRTAPMGEQRLIQVRASGRGGDQKVSLVLMVAEDDGGAFGLAQIPTSVFLGTSTAGGANVSISGRGAVGPDTEVGIDFRRLGSFTGQTYGQTDLWGPRALLSVRRGAFRAEAGDLTLQNDGIFSGVVGAGTGLQLRRQGKSLDGGILLARPRGGLGAAQSGHLLQGELGHALGGGTLSARVLDFDWGQASFFGAGRLQVAGLRYELAGPGPHRLTAEAGLVRQSVGQPDETQGASVDARYAYSTPRLAVSAHLRRTPDQHRGTTLVGDEASVSGSAAVLPALRLNGSAYRGTRTQAGSQSGDESRGASTGIQLHGLGSSLGLAWNTRQYQGAFTLGGQEQRNSVAASLGTGIGRLSLLGSAEASVVERGDMAPYGARRLQGQLRWSQPSKSAWLSVNYTDETLFRSPLQTELGARLRLGEINFDAAVGASVINGSSQVGYLHTGAEVYVSRTLSLVAGTEYTPWSANRSPWTFSLGIRRALSLPLPLRETPRVGGLIFEDRNGNGRQDRGEPGLGGVTISIGPLQTVTRDDGSFAFRSAVPAGLPVQMDVGSLDEGYLAQASETLVPASGRIEMPVVRAAALELALFEDRNGDQSRNGAEPHLEGALVVLKDPAGRSYPRTTDARGSTTFSALPPGVYAVSMQRGEQEIPVARIELAPGERVAREIGVAAPSRQIKMWTGPDAPAQR